MKQQLINEQFQMMYGGEQKKNDSLWPSLIGLSAFLSRDYYVNLPPEAVEVVQTNSEIDPQIVQYCLQTVGQIITPDQLEKMDESIYINKFSVTAECGRVMEVPTNHTALQGLTLTHKGVGATEFARKYPLQNPYAGYVDLNHRNDVKQHLRQLAYYDAVGVLGIESALKEFNMSLMLINLGIENIQIPVLVAKLKSIYDEDGSLTDTSDIDHLNVQNCGDIAIFTRLTDTNFRLMDLKVLENLGKKDEIANILNHSYSIYCQKYSQNETKKFSDYIIFLIQRVAKNEMKMAMKGYFCDCTEWQDVSRNISLTGERFDCEGIGLIQDFNHEQVSRVIDYIFNSLLACFSIFKEHAETSDPSVELKLSDFLLEILNTVVDTYFENLSDTYVHAFSRDWTLRGTFKYILNSLFFAKSDLISDRDYRDYKTKVEEIINSSRFGFRKEYIKQMLRSSYGGLKNLNSLEWQSFF
jgi:hypothetical protein